MAAQQQAPISFEETITRVTQTLKARGLKVYRSFDLRTALDAIPDCCCPYHGTEQCTCEYAVLLVYVDRGLPVLVNLHGRDGETWVAVPETEGASFSARDRISDILSVMFTSTAIHKR